jgi:repressor LexA
MFHERVFALGDRIHYHRLVRPREEIAMGDTALAGKRRHILEFIAEQIRQRGYPPSVREIGEAVGLTSSSTVHAHLQVLQRDGFLQRDPTKPRAIVVNFEPSSGAAVRVRPASHVPLLGDVAAGTGVLAEQNVEEVLPIPEDFTGPGELFMLRVRGDSMIEAGILEGDFVVVHRQPEANAGEIVVAGIPGEEATVKTFKRRRNKIVLVPANPRFDEMEFRPEDITIYGKVVTVLRRL